MIALDTNVLVRYLVADDPSQAQAARALLAELTSERPGFVCRETAVELSWVLDRAYGFSRDRIATILEALVTSEELRFEAADDVIRAADGYRRGGAGFADRMMAAAARRHDAEALYTFDRQVARLPGAVLLADAASRQPPRSR